MRDSFRPGSGRVPRAIVVEVHQLERDLDGFSLDAPSDAGASSRRRRFEPKPLRTFRLALHADQMRPEGIEMIGGASAPHAGWMPAQGLPLYAME